MRVLVLNCKRVRRFFCSYKTIQMDRNYNGQVLQDILGAYLGVMCVFLPNQAQYMFFVRKRYFGGVYVLLQKNRKQEEVSV